MKSSSIATLFAALVAAVSAAPTKRAAPGQKNIDTVILNYALTLEHLEATFYNDYLPSAAEFRSAGYADFIRERYIEIGGEEKNHVNFLSTALGDAAVQRCDYDFGLTGVDSFVAFSQLVEGVGISAYLGAAQNITETTYLTAAASILTVEGRHSAWIQSVPVASDAFPSPYDTPLDFNQAYSLAAPVIKNCPSTNAALPVMAFPAATFSPTPTKLGQTISVASSKLCDGDQIGFISGLASAIVPVNNGKVTLPSIVNYGRTYAVILKKAAKTITDDNTKAGPIAFDILPSATVGAAFQQSNKQV